MEVKDVASSQSFSDTTAQQGGAIASSANAQPQSSDSAAAVDTHGGDQSSTVLQSANQVISIVNIASGATAEIGQLVKSISGIVDQAGKGSVPQNRLAVLQREANQLVGAIRKKAAGASDGSLNPLAGDKVQLDASHVIGQKVEVALPQGAANAFGLDKLDFSNQQGIESARSAVSDAQQQLTQLKQAVDNSKSAVQTTVSHLDVALQNSASSRSRVRDLDEALKLANGTKHRITGDEASALASYGPLDPRLLNLLE